MATATAAAECGICGQPPGECYHQCPNSSHYYSPEQERYDDQFYGCDRYDGWDDPDIDAEDPAELDDEAPPATPTVAPAAVVAVPAAFDPSDIPF